MNKLIIGAVVTVALGEWLVLAFFSLLALTFGVGTGAASFVVWITTAVAVGYPIFFGVPLLLLREKIGKTKWYWFITGFNVFPPLMWGLMEVLDSAGFY